ncbi:MAG TPA: putative lipid II flippase FtsW [Acidobacteriota bacterium]|nr:putative lipid II flippase FtsW [Acidobacteriota bacterium]
MTRRMPYDQHLIVISLFLAGLGLVMVSSASSAVSQEVYGSASAIFMRQLTATLIGLGGLLVAMRFDYHLLENRWVIGLLMILAVAGLILPHVMGGGPAARWIRIGPLQFQPSEAAKLTAVVFTAYYLSRRGVNLASFRRGLVPYLTAVGLLIALILAGRDLGTAALVVGVCGMLLYLGGLRYLHMPILAGAGALGAVALILTEPYRLQRVLSWFEPGRDVQGAGYQIHQSLIAVGSGQLSGKGLAEGTQKLHFLPEPHTDFIFAVLGEELGLVGCLVLLLLFGFFLWRGVRIALRADSLFGFYLALGIVSMIVLQALVNISVVLHLLPTKGLPLPFISVGGSSQMVLLTAVGLLLNISKHTRADADVNVIPSLYPSQGEVMR